VKKLRLSAQTVCLLTQFATRPTVWRYGYELSRETGLKSGTLYPILIRLAKHSMLETKWVVTEDGVPPRHTYRLTAKGAEAAKHLAKETRLPWKARRPALVGGKA
jgi:PadR family transcriptional regulator, regulatory protein PadR